MTLVAALLGGQTLAAGCPDCEPGRQARALLLQEDFFATAALVLAPFFILGLFTGVIHLVLSCADARNKELP